MCGGCVSPTALLALRMPRRPTSQEPTTATRAQPNGSGLCSSSSSDATAAVAAAIQQNTHSPSGSSNSNKQQKQNETKKTSKEKNCHANDSRLQRAIVYRVCVCCCCCCSCCQLTTTCSRCCLLLARLHAHHPSAHTLPAKLKRSRFHMLRAPQCYVGAPARVGIFVAMLGHDVRSARARADCDV